MMKRPCSCPVWKPLSIFCWMVVRSSAKRLLSLARASSVCSPQLYSRAFRLPLLQPLNPTRCGVRHLYVLVQVNALIRRNQTFIKRLGGVPGQGGEADLAYELSGNPAALNTALALTRFSGRVVIGSWYGAKKNELDLGSFFHRGRVSLISSQVSSLAPHLTGRWNNKRRLDLAWKMLRLVRPSNCITHRFALADASLAYSLIDHCPEETIQVIFDHKLPDKK